LKETIKQGLLWPSAESIIRIDPMIDCVFKAILGKKQNKKVLINFLNSVLELTGESAILDAEILNPYNEREFITDKLSIVDIKVRDSISGSYDIEVQAHPHPCLASRMLYGWSTYYRNEINKGDGYSKLIPTTSIWLLNDSLFKDTNAGHLCFYAYDPVNNLYLSEHFKIHVIQLDKFRFKSKALTDKERWLKFFKEGKNMNPYKIPSDMKTRSLENAFYTMRGFLESQRNYLLYQSRLDSERERATWDTLVNEAKRDKDIAKRDKDIAKKDKDIAKRTIEKAKKIREKARKIRELAQKADSQPLTAS
jgi:predicted transposase/invertase (TIGR01784 family)